MQVLVNKRKENKSQAATPAVGRKSGNEISHGVVDIRPEAIQMRKLQELASNSPGNKALTQLRAMASHHAAGRALPVQKKENKTGLPDNLKSGIENLSGYAMDDVKVHYNSGKPEQLNAHAYAQGTDIHVASGREKHLPHEAWHVVQQKQGRVAPTLQMNGGVNVNDDKGLEREADVMGANALQVASKVADPEKNVLLQQKPAEISMAPLPLQRQLTIDNNVVDESLITTKGAYKTRLNKIISDEANAAGVAPNAVRSKLVAMTRNGVHAFNTKRDAVLEAIMDIKWDALRTHRDIVYGNPPLTEANTQTILTNVEGGDPNALLNLLRNGAAYVPRAPDVARSHEWGVIKAKTRLDECMLIIGDATGVNFQPFLNCSHGIAHSHPYFENMHAPGGRNRLGGVSTNTKEIANHGALPAGMVSWNDLINKTGEASTEVSKIFPSASDIQFSGDQQLATHTVYTTYAVLRNNSGAFYIANPNTGGGQFNGAPRLNFLIQNAQKAPDGVNYTCVMDALEGGTSIWTQQVTTVGVGQFGLLRW